MAAMNGKGLVCILSLGALMVLIMVAQPVDASSFVAYSGSGCTGESSTLNACGCNTIPAGQKAGYEWTYNGQTGAAYNGDDCTGVAQTHFTTSVNGCSPFGWSSFFIQC